VLPTKKSTAKKLKMEEYILRSNIDFIVSICSNWHAGLAKINGGFPYSKLGHWRWSLDFRCFRWSWRYINHMITPYTGAEVAHFVKKYFIKELKKLESFKKKDYKAALNDCFLKMDSLMLSKEGQKEI
jgi:hypothetical protein